MQNTTITNVVSQLTCTAEVEALTYSAGRLDTESKGSTRFSNPKAMGCSDPCAARVLLRAWKLLNRVDPIGLGA